MKTNNILVNWNKFCNAAPEQETFAENFIVKIQNLDQCELAVQAKQVQHEEEPGFGVNITFFHCNCFLSGICSCFLDTKFTHN